jgi:DNA sulfur modification protein DndC
MARLLDTERQFHAKSRRGIYENLEKCFASSSRSKEEAIENAHYQRNLKNTVKALKDDRAEIHEVRQQFEECDRDEAKQLNLTWASMKFPTKNSGEANSED